MGDRYNYCERCGKEKPIELDWCEKCDPPTPYDSELYFEFAEIDWRWLIGHNLAAAGALNKSRADERKRCLDIVFAYIRGELDMVGLHKWTDSDQRRKPLGTVPDGG